jgi:hypothetical protein
MMKHLEGSNGTLQMRRQAALIIDFILDLMCVKKEKDTNYSKMIANKQEIGDNI